MNEKDKKLKQLKEEVVGCEKCSLYKTRNMPVIGEGDHDANVMFIGEAPGAQEDKTGRPFCGKAGDILNNLLEGAGLEREEIYIANVLKCRPPDNRDPKQEEIEACTPYLGRQIEIIEPEVIVGLGNFGTKFVLSKYNLKGKIEGISQIHGETFSAKTLFGEIKIVPMYHPAVATYNPNMIDTLEEDFEVLKKFK